HIRKIGLVVTVENCAYLRFRLVGIAMAHEVTHIGRARDYRIAPLYDKALQATVDRAIDQAVRRPWLGRVLDPWIAKIRDPRSRGNRCKAARYQMCSRMRTRGVNKIDGIPADHASSR